MANPVIRRNLKVGAEDAEADQRFLETCFVDTGDIDVLIDCQDPRCLVLGRTGSGKTALLLQALKSGAHTVELAPETLALSYITNSNVLRFFEEAGVDLEVFYRLLWRHIIVVELLKLKYHINSEAQQSAFLESIKATFNRDKTKQRAFAYLQDWGDKFWLETEYRTREFTEKLENDLKVSVGIDSSFINAGAEGAAKLTSEQRGEVRQRGSQVVNAVQIKELHTVIQFLHEEIFTKSYDHYYLVIDRLDERWVDDRIRFKLIKALLETVRSFKTITNVKIIVALRTDLHRRVLKEIKNPGDQEEKFKSLYLPIRWTRDQLVKVLDDRVNCLYRRQYTTDNVRLTDIFPSTKMDQREPIDYLLDRTFFRPREAIIFMNECLARSEGQSVITITSIREAEVGYSRGRLDSLADEWRREFPRLDDAVRILSRRETPFALDQITRDECIAFAKLVLKNESHYEDPVYQLCEEFFTGEPKDHLPFVKAVLLILYQVGLIGVKPAPHLGRQWSFDDATVLEEENLKPDAQIEIHKTFWAALGVISRGRGRNAS